jgi:hypothetical protein
LVSRKDDRNTPCPAEMADHVLRSRSVGTASPKLTESWQTPRGRGCGVGRESKQGGLAGSGGNFVHAEAVKTGFCQ